MADRYDLTANVTETSGSSSSSNSVVIQSNVSLGTTVVGSVVGGGVGPAGPAGANGTDGVGVPTGGTTGQVLRKASNANFDTEWSSADASGVTSVNTRTGAVTLDKTDVGLSNVDNTSDAAKPISTATQTALNGKAASSHTHAVGEVTGFDAAVSANTDVAANTAARHTHSNAAVLNATTASFTTADETKLDGIATGATQNASDAALRDRSTHTGSQAIATVTGLQTVLDGKAATTHTHAQSDVTGLVTALSGKEPTITAGTTAQYYRGDKSFQMLDKTAVGLGSVDNTSDATKYAASVTLTNKTISGASNTLTNIPQSSVTNLTTDLAGKAPTSHTHTLSQITNLTIGTTPPGSPSLNDLWYDTN